MAAWETVIGLEIHTQLATSSKIFSGASTAFGAQANTLACVVDLGFPGVLPVLNAKVVTMAVKFGTNRPCWEGYPSENSSRSRRVIANI